MILFDLRCATGHVFEAWFGSSADYEDQRGRGLVACPLCDDARIEKAVMAPNVSPKGNRLPELHVTATSGADPTEIKRLMRKLATLQSEMLASAEHVGDRFAEEARAIHYGEADARPIYGETSAKDARSLLEDGIEIAALPFPVAPRNDA